MSIRMGDTTRPTMKGTVIEPEKYLDRDGDNEAYDAYTLKPAYL